MRYFPFYCCLLVSVLFSGCGRQGASGSYLASFRNGLYWLQLIDNQQQISGQFESVIVDEHGKIESVEGSVSGVRDSHEITLSLKPALLLPITVNASGTLAGDQLTLTGKLGGSQPESVVLIRSDLAEFQKQLAAVNEQSRSLLAAWAEATARRRAQQEEEQEIAQLRQLVVQMQSFHAVVQQSLPNVPQIEQHYRAITSRLEECQKRKQAWAGTPQAAVRSGQVIAATSALLVESQGLRVRLSGNESRFQADAEPLHQRVAEAQQSCQHTPAFVSVSAFPTDSWNAACGALQQAAPSFEQDFEAMSRGLTRMETAYQAERAKQEQLVQADIAPIN